MGEYVPDGSESDETTVLLEVRDELRKLNALFEEFVPMLRGYFDPNQPGPRGYFMRKQLAKGNGHG